jgi:hypothetical protein
VPVPYHLCSMMLTSISTNFNWPLHSKRRQTEKANNELRKVTRLSSYILRLNTTIRWVTAEIVVEIKLKACMWELPTKITKY